MASGLRAELKQRKPFATTEEVVFLNALRTADHLLRGEVEVLKGADLTFAQYNVLRILRGAGREGISCGEISDRMVTRDSDITRLLDRLEAKSLVRRERSVEDRRVVMVSLTEVGVNAMAAAPGVLSKVFNDHLAGFNDEEFRTLISLLQRIVETGSSIAILDITGVPTVDTLVAQHLLKTVAAARLMGADCIISGIRPQIAQTIVHLGVDLNAVTTKATLADAFAVALKRLGLGVAPVRNGQAPLTGATAGAAPPDTKGA